jgi:hypothetical protein
MKSNRQSAKYTGKTDSPALLEFLEHGEGGRWPLFAVFRKARMLSRKLFRAPMDARNAQRWVSLAGEAMTCLAG